MSNVIDSLVVELGLDPKKFTEGQKAAIDAFKKTQDAAVAHGKEIEASGNKAAEAITRVKTQVLALGAALLGAASMKEFVKNVTTADVAAGRFAKTMDISVGELSAWQGAAVEVGGTAEGITSSLGGLSSQLQKFLITLQPPEALQYFDALGIKIEGTNGKLKTSAQLWLEVAQKTQGMDPARISALVSGLGGDQSMLALILKGPAALQEALAANKKYAISDKDVAAAEALTKAWGAMSASATSMGRALVTELLPPLVATLSWMERISGKIKTDLGTSEVRIEPGSAAATGLPWLMGLIWGPKTAAEVEALIHPQSHSGKLGGGGAGAGAGLRLKAGATGGGAATLGLTALAASLQADIPGLKQFTALNDAFHAGSNSAHVSGRALDFTLNDPAQSAAVAAQVRAKLTAMGIDAKVIDEYMNPSAHATGGHIHVQFNSALAAQRYSELAGAGAAARSSISNDNRASHSTSQTSIGKIEVHTQATDAKGIARDLKPAIERNSFATQANGGAN